MQNVSFKWNNISIILKTRSLSTKEIQFLYTLT